MARVAVDPTILAHGWIFVGRRRQLLVVFALTKLRRLAEQPDLKLMQDLASSTQGIEVHGGAALDSQVIEWIEDIAPGAPTDLELVGSRPLFDLVTAGVRAECKREPDLYEKVLDGRIEPLAVDYATIPERQAREPDPLEQALHAGFHGQCDVIVSDALAGRYGSPAELNDNAGHAVELRSFEDFVGSYVEGNGFELAQINPRLAADVTKALQSVHPGRARL
jgi:hypothetical protein